MLVELEYDRCVVSTLLLVRAVYPDKSVLQFTGHPPPEHCTVVDHGLALSRPLAMIARSLAWAGSWIRQRVVVRDSYDREGWSSAYIRRAPQYSDVLGVSSPARHHCWMAVYNQSTAVHQTDVSRGTILGWVHGATLGQQVFPLHSGLVCVAADAHIRAAR